METEKSEPQNKMNYEVRLRASMSGGGEIIGRVRNQIKVGSLAARISQVVI